MKRREKMEKASEICNVDTKVFDTSVELASGMY